MQTQCTPRRYRVEHVHGLNRIAKVLGITRSAAIRLAQTGELQTYQAHGHTCALAETIDKHDRSETNIDRWESEGGAIHER